MGPHFTLYQVQIASVRWILKSDTIKIYIRFFLSSKTNDNMIEFIIFKYIIHSIELDFFKYIKIYFVLI